MVRESFLNDLGCLDLLLLGRFIALKERGDFMSGVVEFVRALFVSGFWLLRLGLMKPTFIILIALTYDAYKTPRFSFSKFNRMLVGETNHISNHQSKRQ